MDRAVLAGDPPIEIALKRSDRARRYSLRVSGLDGRVTLTFPRYGSAAEAIAFVRSREVWIRGALSRRPDVVRVGPGTAVPVEGRPALIEMARVPAVRHEDGRLLVPGDPARSGIRVEAFLKARARTLLSAATESHAADLGRTPGRLTLRDTRSRWGSCSAAGDFMYSWRLVMAPPDVLDYVAAHEVAHLIEMNHAPAFWAVVVALCPDWRRHRSWLRREGGALHRFRFRD